METLSPREEEEERRMNEEIFGGYNFICFAFASSRATGGLSFGCVVKPATNWAFQ